MGFNLVSKGLVVLHIVCGDAVPIKSSRKTVMSGINLSLLPFVIVFLRGFFNQLDSDVFLILGAPGRTFKASMSFAKDSVAQPVHPAQTS